MTKSFLLQLLILAPKSTFRKGPPCWPLNSGPLTLPQNFCWGSSPVKRHVKLWTKYKILFFFLKTLHIGTSDLSLPVCLLQIQPRSSLYLWLSRWCLLHVPACCCLPSPWKEQPYMPGLLFPKTSEGRPRVGTHLLFASHLIMCIFLVTFYEYFHAKSQINSVGLICHWKKLKLMFGTYL